MSEMFPMSRLLLLLVLLVTPVAGAETRHLTVAGAGGVPLTVATAGDPGHPALLFIHGMAQSHFAFHSQFDSDLADDYYLVSFDLRGHGASGKPWDADAYGSAAVWAEDVAAVLAATGATRPLIIGWSFGSLVALDYLRESGAGSASGLLLTGAIGALMPFRMPDDDPLAAEFRKVREQQFSADPRQQVEASERMVDWLTSAKLPPAERQVLQSTTMMFPAYARRAIYARRQDNRDLLSRLADLPLLLAIGSDDNPLLLEDAAALAAGNPNIAWSRYEGAGHSVFLEQPQRFNGELRAFAARCFGDAKH